MAIRIAAVLCMLSAAGFGGFTIPAMRNLLSGRDLPRMFGFRAYGDGPFERYGLKTFVWLLALFLLVCLAEGVAGWLLWNGQRGGAYLALALLPFGAVFWWGFALPIAWLFGVVRTILIIVGWNSLH